MKMWKKYLFCHIARCFALFCIAFFLVYSLIDLASQIKHIHAHDWLEYPVYYFNQFIKRIDLIFPIAFAIGLVYALTSLFSNFELIALEMSGLSRRKLLLPFFAFAIMLTSITYCSYEWLSPKAKIFIENFDTKSKKKPILQNARKPGLYNYELKNGEKLLFSYATPENDSVHSVYLILSPDEIWHMQKLSIKSKLGQFVDKLERQNNGKLVATVSLPTRIFKEINFNLSQIPKKTNPYSLMSLSELSQNTESPKGKTQLYLRLILPLLPCLIAFAIPPFAFAFSRTRSRPLLLYTLVLFAILCYFALTSALTILGENQVLAPFFATAFLPIALFALFCTAFYRST